MSQSSVQHLSRTVNFRSLLIVCNGGIFVVDTLVVNCSVCWSSILPKDIVRWCFVRRVGTAGARCGLNNNAAQRLIYAINAVCWPNSIRPPDNRGFWSPRFCMYRHFSFKVYGVWASYSWIGYERARCRLATTIISSDEPKLTDDSIIYRQLIIDRFHLQKHSLRRVNMHFSLSELSVFEPAYRIASARVFFVETFVASFRFVYRV